MSRSSLQHRRPAIFGVGAVSGYGWGADALWAGTLSGRSSVRPVEVDGQTYLAARPPDGGSADDHPSRYGKALFAATREAVADARLSGWRPGPRVGLIGVSSIGDVEYRRSYLRESGGRLRGRDYLGLMPSTAPAMLMRDLGFSGGPVMNIQAACASYNVALVLANLWLASGMATDVIVASSDFSAMPEDAVQFNKLGALAVEGEPLDVCRPFQPGSKGFVVGEGAATLVLSTGGDTPYGSLLGGSMLHDPYHPIAINPDLTCLVDTFDGAIISAGVSVDEIKYLYTHGTGTAQNDAAEVAVAEKILRPDITFLATKPLTGHCQGASAGIEAVLIAMASARRIVPSVMPVEAPYHRLARGPQPLEPGLILKSAIGMGGFNSAVIFAPAA
jgi:3-oxoacyl-[acyl-carrier-protein] synthase II